MPKKKKESLQHPAQKKRRERIQQILDAVAKGESDAKKIFATYAYNEGITWRTFQEYLRVLVDLGKIEYDPFQQIIKLKET